MSDDITDKGLLKATMFDRAARIMAEMPPSVARANVPTELPPPEDAQMAISRSTFAGMSNSDLSDVLTFIGDELREREDMCASEGVAIHAVRMAARHLFCPRSVVDDWHTRIHALANQLEMGKISAFIKYLAGHRKRGGRLL